MSTILFRPVGLYELALIWDSGMREFPPRLPHQPVFYPVTNAEYARQIARDWNTQDEKSGFAGFVTAFPVNEDYLSGFEPHTVGASRHEEYWIPSDDLSSFNRAIIDQVRVEEAFFGDNFIGHVPETCGLKGKDATAQFVTLCKLWNDSTFDVGCEVSANRKAVYLNCLFWATHDFSQYGLSKRQQEEFIGNLRKIWDFNHLELPLPGRLAV